MLVTIALLSGCAELPATDATTDAPTLVWPSSPATQKIKFLRAFSSPDDFENRPGWFKRMLDAIKGSPKRPLVNPTGVHRDREGRLYVVDAFYNAVHVFDPVRRDYYWFPKRPMESFMKPVGIAVGEEGRVYISDSQAKVVHIFEQHGKQYLKSIGADELQRPTGLTINKQTNELLVVDTLASQIVVFDADSLLIKRTIGHAGYDSSALHYPTNIHASNEGSVYVTDSLNFRVQVLSPELRFSRHFGSAGDTPGHFSRPKGIAVDSDGNIYVVDALFDNVQIFNGQGQLLLAFGSPGHESGQFWLPSGIFIDEQDQIYIADSYNRRVQVFQYLK
jgi:DNA-binding beta-propeller fold protein YncE